MSKTTVDIISCYEKLISRQDSNINIHATIKETEQHKKIKRCGAKLLEDLGFCDKDIKCEAPFNKGIADVNGKNERFNIAIECGNTSPIKLAQMVEVYDFVIHIPFRKEAYRFLIPCTIAYKDNKSIIIVKIDQENYCSQIINVITPYEKVKGTIHLHPTIFDERCKSLAELRQKVYLQESILDTLDTKLKYCIFRLHQMTRFERINGKTICSVTNLSSTELKHGIGDVFNILVNSILHTHPSIWVPEIYYKRNEGLKNEFEIWHKRSFKGAIGTNLKSLHISPIRGWNVFDQPIFDTVPNDCSVGYTYEQLLFDENFINFDKFNNFDEFNTEVHEIIPWRDCFK